MTAGRGFIALAAVIIGRWTPIGAFGAALLFSATTALQVAIGVNPPTGQLGSVLLAIPNQLFGALPYIVTIIVLAGFIGRSVAPAADGQPYTREAATTVGEQMGSLAGMIRDNAPHDGAIATAATTVAGGLESASTYLK
jgi:simple sugar transport system permease protein